MTSLFLLAAVHTPDLMPPLSLSSYGKSFNPGTIFVAPLYILSIFPVSSFRRDDHTAAAYSISVPVAVTVMLVIIPARCKASVCDRMA